MPVEEIVSDETEPSIQEAAVYHETKQETVTSPVSSPEPRSSDQYKAIACAIPEKPRSSTIEFEQYISRENAYPSIQNLEISESLSEFYRIRKHFLIFTDAGKPIYSRFGDETVLAPFFATISAVMPKIQSYFWDNAVHAKQIKNKLRVLRGKDFVISFLKKGSLIYMCISNMSQRGPDGEVFLDERDVT